MQFDYQKYRRSSVDSALIETYQRMTDELDFGRGAEKRTRRQTKFLFHMVVIDLLKDVLTRFDIEPSRKNCTNALLKLLSSGQESSAQALLNTAVEVVDGYLTEGTDACVFDEPAYKNTFNYDLYAFLKWERLGKSEENCPRFRNLLAVNKVAMGQRVGDQPSIRETIKNSIVS